MVKPKFTLLGDNDLKVGHVLAGTGDLCWGREFLQRLGVAVFDRSIALSGQDSGQGFVDGVRTFARNVRETGPIDLVDQFLADQMRSTSRLAWLHALTRWYMQGFPAIVLRSHTYAAALAATSIPGDIEFRAPFKSVLVQLPDGLLPNVWATMLHESEFGDGLWTVVVYFSDGRMKKMLLRVPFDNHMRGDLGQATVEVHPADDGWRSNEITATLVRLQHVVARIAFGSCLALTADKQRSNGKADEPASGRPPRDRGLLPSCRVFQVGSPVSVDCRKAILEYVEHGSKSRGPLTLQFLVRGHWRNQACGPQMLERRLTWIEPYWKGPNDAPINIRPHELLGEK